MALANFQQVLREAVAYFSKRGYTNKQDLDSWAMRLEQAARASLVSPRVASALIARHLAAVYGRIVRRLPKHLQQLQRLQAGQRLGPEAYFRRVETFPQLAMKMRTELDRRIEAATDLIVLRREEAIAATKRRFTGWASSVPPGGTPEPPRRETKLLNAEFRQIRFETNRLNIDQGHKLNAALNATYAEGTGAIAGIWHSNWRQDPSRQTYRWRPDHKDRDLEIFTIRDNWALQAGLMKAGPAGYTDQITQPAEEISCRCYYEYLYNLDALPVSMLTAKGKKALNLMENLDGANDQ